MWLHFLSHGNCIYNGVDIYSNFHVHPNRNATWISILYKTIAGDFELPRVLENPKCPQFVFLFWKFHMLNSASPSSFPFFLSGHSKGVLLSRIHAVGSLQKDTDAITSRRWRQFCKCFFPSFFFFSSCFSCFEIGPVSTLNPCFVKLELRSIQSIDRGITQLRA